MDFFNNEYGSIFSSIKPSVSAINPVGASLSKFSTSTENEDMRSRASTILEEPYLQGTIGTVFNCEQGYLKSSLRKEEKKKRQKKDTFLFMS